MAYLCDPRIGAFAVGSRQFQPPALVGRAVLAQGALARALAPSTLKIWVSLEAQPTALTHGPTLVEVNCGRQGQEALWDGEGLRMATGKLWVPIWSQLSFHQAPVTLSHPGSHHSAQPRVQNDRET